MGGLGPGIGGLEYLVIGVVALLVLGPERLPVMLNKLGKLVAKARGMANEFRSSFDELARQSELDDLRKEVEALRSNTGAVALGADADAAFRDIKTELNRPVDAPNAVMLPTQTEWPDMTGPITPASETAQEVKTPKVRARKAVAPVSAATKSKATKASAAAKTPAEKTTPKTTPVANVSKTISKKTTPRNSKLDL